MGKTVGAMRNLVLGSAIAVVAFALSITPSRAKNSEVKVGIGVVLYNGELLAKNIEPGKANLTFDIRPTELWTGGVVHCTVAYLAQADAPAIANLRTIESDMVSLLKDMKDRPQSSTVKDGHVRSSFEYYPYYASVDLDLMYERDGTYAHLFEKFYTMKDTTVSASRQAFGQYKLSCIGNSKNPNDRLATGISSKIHLMMPPLPPEALKAAR